MARPFPGRREQIMLTVLLTRMKCDMQFLESFKAAYGAARAHAVTLDQANNQDASSAPAPGFASMYKKSKEVTTNAFALVAKFEEVAQRIEKIDTTALVENEWGEQDAVMVSLLEDGKKIGIEKCRRILMASKDPLHEEGGAEEDNVPKESNDANQGSFFISGKGKVVGGWGNVAKKQAKAFKKLVKALAVQVEVV